MGFVWFKKRDTVGSDIIVIYTSHVIAELLIGWHDFDVTHNDK